MWSPQSRSTLRWRELQQFLISGFEAWDDHSTFNSKPSMMWGVWLYSVPKLFPLWVATSHECLGCFPLSQRLNFAIQVPYNAKDCKTEEQLKQWCLGLKASEKCSWVARPFLDIFSGWDHRNINGISAWYWWCTVSISHHERYRTVCFINLDTGYLVCLTSIWVVWVPGTWRKDVEM